MKKTSRREFLRIGSAVSGMGVAAPWVLNLSAFQNASAQSVGSGYKALVCVYLAGGNDAFNTVLATDSTSWGHYTRVRDPRVSDATSSADSIALSSSAVLPISHRNAAGLNTGRQFALHPNLSQVRTLYNAGRLAVVANVGTLNRPTTPTQYADVTHPRPAKLFSHNDQQSTWQSFSPEGSTAGWGGRFADNQSSKNSNQMFASVGVDTNAVWCSGASTRQFQVASAGPNRFGYSADGNVPSFMTAGVRSAMASVSGADARGDMLGSDHAAVTKRAQDAQSVLTASLPAMALAPWGTPGATSQAADAKLCCVLPSTGASTYNPLAGQLQMVARMMAARSGTGGSRQVFYVSLGGFDTHSGHISKHADLMAQLDHALAYFDTVLGAMPGGSMRSQVTTFTASDFGRGFTNNDGGCDHGWGGHHFVMGGAVQGGDVYGHFPEYRSPDSAGKFVNAPNQLLNGALLPEVSVDQYAYTLGRWFDVADADLIGTTSGAGILPNIHNFDAGVRNLRFLG